MSRGINKVILIATLGKDPEIRTFQDGGSVANVSAATNEEWKDRDGVKQSRTEWHNLVFHGRLAEVVAQYLRKGSKVYVGGSLRTRKWQDKEGKDRYTTEIHASEMQMLDGKPEGEPQPRERQREQTRESMRRESAPTQADGGGFDDDIPF